jgi:hypothetical protein
MSDQENKNGGSSVFSRLTSGIKDALFEDEHPRIPDKTTNNSVARTSITQSAITPPAYTTGTVSGEDRAKAIEVLSGRVLSGDTPYVEYRTTYEALEGTVSPDDNRRKAALAVVSKKYGIAQVARSIVVHKETLAQERNVFEQSLSPKQGGPIEAYEKDVATKEQSIQAKNSEIERLKREIEDLEQGKKVSQEKIMEERVKHEHARAVFEVAFNGLSQGIEADEQLINSQLPKGA